MNAEASLEPAPLARRLYAAALRAVAPARLFDAPDLLAPVAATAGQVRVLAVGKAAAGMWAAFAERLGRPVAEALVVVPHGHPVEGPAPARVLHAGHPTPDAGSVAAADAALALARQGRPSDALVVLLSGGTSALLGAPVEGLTLGDVQATTQALLACGAPIGVVNAVRGRLTRASAGRLAAASRAPVFTYALSDVPGDDPAVLGGAPTVGDPDGPVRARAALDAYALRAHLPGAVLAAIERGRTPAVSVRTAYRIVGANGMALEAAADVARAAGYEVHVRPGALTGEARDAGRTLAAGLQALPPRSVLLAGGETTVTLGPSPGQGGRNQEAALAAALVLERLPARGVLLCAGTDGRDGPTDAAGALVSAETAPAIRRAGLDPEVALARHDAGTALAAAGALILTGPTGTNVMDVAIALAP